MSQVHAVDVIVTAPLVQAIEVTLPANTAAAIDVIAETVLVVDVVSGQGPQGPPGTGGAADWDDITDKPATFPPTLPITQSGVTNLVADLALKAPLASPTFTGDPTAPTPALADNDTSIATTEYVTTAIAAIPPTGSLLSGFWNYNSAGTVPPPASGRVRLSVAWPPTLGASVHLYIHNTDIDGFPYTWALGPNVNDLLVVRSASGARLDGTVTAKSSSTYLDVTITVAAVSGNWAGNSRTQIAAIQFVGNYLPLAGGTLTGPLAGTTATFSGAVTAPNIVKITVGTTAPASPGVGDIWIDTN